MTHPLRVDWLLGQLFDRAEIKRFLLWRGYGQLVDDLCWDLARTDFCVELGERLERHGLIDAAFFQALREERPRAHETIDQVAAAVLGPGRGSRPALVPPPPGLADGREPPGTRREGARLQRPSPEPSPAPAAPSAQPPVAAPGSGVAQAGVRCGAAGGRILVVLAEPDGQPPLPRAQEEARLIQDCWSGARAQTPVSLLVATSFVDLLNRISDLSPSVVHFIGHSKRRGIVLRDARGEPMLVSASKLLDLFQIQRQSGNPIELLVLNACESAGHAAALVPSVGVAIGVAGRLPESSGVPFGHILHTRLFRGDPIALAFARASLAAGMAAVADYQLYPSDPGAGEPAPGA